MATANPIRAHFFNSPEHGHVVELKAAADPFGTTVMHKVSPEHIERFPEAWDAYFRGLPTVDYAGTPLLDVPGIERSMLTAYALQGIHNAEQLAAVTDGGLPTFGLGARAVRDAARQLLALNDAKAQTEAAEADRARLVELEAKAAEKDAETVDRDKRIAELEALLADKSADAGSKAVKAANKAQA